MNNDIQINDSNIDTFSNLIKLMNRFATENLSEEVKTTCYASASAEARKYNCQFK